MAIPFTPSGRYRAARCHASCYLQRAKRRGTQRPALRGTGFHAFAVRCRLIGYDAALLEVPLDAPHRSLCEAVNPLLLPIVWAAARQEIAFAYHVASDTARELVGVEDRQYAAACLPGEIPGTVDIIEVAAGLLMVADLKTGRWSASYRMQIRMYLLMCARALGMDRGTTQCIYVDEDGEARIVAESLDAFDLEDEAQQIRELCASVAESEARYLASGIADTHAGEWCTYCDSRPHCPEYGAVGRELADGLTERSFLDRVRADLAHADGRAKWYLFAEKAPAMVDEIRAAVLACAPFTLPDGREVREQTTTARAVTDSAAVRAGLEALGWTAAANAATVLEQRITIGSLERALGGAKKAEQVIERLIAKGAGIVRNVSTGVTAVEKRDRR